MREVYIAVAGGGRAKSLLYREPKRARPFQPKAEKLGSKVRAYREKSLAFTQS